jgi:hypothetical protein
MRVRAIAVGASVAAAFILVYILGIQRFATRALPRTYVGDLDVSGLTAEEAQKALEDETANYACDVTVGDFTGTVKGADVAFDRDEERMARLAVESRPAFAWPVALIFSASINDNQGITFDEGALNNAVNALVGDYNRVNVTSEDVEIVFDEDQNLYQVVGSTTGKALIAADVNAALTQELHGFGTSCVLNADEVTEEPTLTDVTDYERVAECANRSRNTDIPIMVNGETVVISYASQNSNWVTIGEGPSVVVNEDAIRAWTQDTVTWAVYREDEFDFYYLDQDAFVSEMVNRLQNGIVDAFEAPLVGERSIEGKSRDYAYERAGWDSSMGRYIDVDLEAQFARLFDENDLHIHVPDGSTPKDGPSAGITMTTALASLVTGHPVSPHIGMTGEISLEGTVNAIGGLPEKLMAAERAGVTRVFIPKDNVEDLRDVAPEVKDKLEIVPGEYVEDVLKAVGIMTE